MQEQSTLRISKTVEVENPLTLNEWTEKYKFGSRVQRKQLDVDMYKRGEYDFQKLVNLINYGANKPVWYLRIFKAITA
jgi:hypothetical protein